ncbi:Tubby-like F-box protein 6 [Raphanus sativus]|uniref:Tubby-like F-box protein 6 n=1 Tax=Raphanus sativus TaxID=3726 RepID=A0A6J0P0W5_RAPSA|nr:tubby-like F-box protein 6 [Raphanus sativus]KAJ4917403.1 Tubby-like F-box protein 6 [Raphanus sativus]
MPFKKIVRELRGRNKAIGSRRGRSHIAPEGSSSSSSSPSSPSPSTDECSEQSIWVDLPPELLLDIIHRIESGQTLWPGRRDVVACASVCRSWRDMTKDEVVQVPELSGLLTFPLSLKQPGPRDAPIQCFIKRERATGIYRLYLGLSPALSGDKSKLLLSAKKVRRATGMEFVISLSGNDFSRSSTSYIGKLRSNFLGTKFTVYENQPPPVYSERSSSNRKLPPSMRVSPWVSSSTHSYNMASILYELNVLRTRGPRRMQCIMNSIPVSSIQEGGQVHFPTEFTNQGNKKNKKSMMDLCTGNMGGESVVKEPLVLKNKSPRWHEQLQCWCLNFKGRVTVASVKNFQLIAAAAEAGKNMNIPEEEQERVILQFGKIGKDIFTMDYRYPISAFQAFAICLSSFDTKPVCE